MLQANIELPKHDGTLVEYSLWYSSVYDLPLQLLVDLYEYEEALGEKVLFTPRLVTFNCSDCPTDVKEKNCYSQGNYCFLPPKSTHGGSMFKDKEIEGRDFLKESLREKCVYETAETKAREKSKGKEGGDR